MKPGTASLVEAHTRRYFKGHRTGTHTWPLGAMARSHPDFHVLEFAPGPTSELWSYVSAGAVDLRSPNDTRLEFVLATADPTERAVELVTMAAWYHSTHGLGIGHTLPIGETWLPGATCDHFLVSRPYPYGPAFEEVALSGEEARILWLLPITGAENEYAATHGLEALERLFDSNAIEYWAADRASVVFDGTG